MVAREGSGVVNSLQVARGIAALCVAVGHATQWTDHPAVSATWDDHILPLTIGVEAFFVLSGFIMYYTSGRRFGDLASVRAFALKRIFRIVPLYWACTLLLAALMLAVGRSVDGLGLSLLFVPYVNPYGLLYPLLGVGWTLNYEMLFYAMFGLAMLLPRRAGLIALFSGAGLMVVAGIFVPEAWTALWFWTRPIILLFVAGVAIGMAYERWGKSRNGWAALGLTVASLLIMPAFDLIGSPPFVDPRAIQAVAIVFACAILVPWPAEAKMPVALIALGNASYALYLIHPIVFRVVATLMPQPGLMGSLAFVAVSLAIAVAVSFPIHRYFEKPIASYAGRRAKPSATR